MDAWASLTRIMNERFRDHLARLPGGTPDHEVAFSRRITTSWALIYYQRRLVRLSPFLFLLPEDELKHGTHWRELDATLRHEAAHAWLYADSGETGHSPRFRDALRVLGVEPNGGCDLGPENAAFRYVYACPGCHAQWPRRARLPGNVSCGDCSPGAYDPAFRLSLQPMEPLALRLRANLTRVEACIAEARSCMETDHVPVAPLAHLR